MIKYLGLPALASEHGRDVDNLILFVHFLMGALFLGWIIYFIYVLLRFRAPKTPRADYVGTKSHASSWIEWAVIVVEGVLLFGLSIPLWAKFADKFPEESKSVVMRVVAQQFAWNAVYAGADGKFAKQDLHLISSTNTLGFDPQDPAGKDDVQVLNDLYAVVNKPVIAHISSKDVVHSFKINSFRVTQDAIPGLSIPTYFTPTKEGTFLIACAQLCGNSHAFMRGFFHVVSQEKFDAWMAENAKKVGGAGASYE
ncbi:MAG TPA: cytochrome c oxidase subunit II [Methylomirabilota bacterium]|nr:cytochrome c oxidase subunit II [Methylomirabilota bacterium]